MADHQKYDAPDGPPPNFNKPMHQDAGPYYGPSQSPAPFQNPREQYGYGSPPPQGQWNQQQSYYPPQGGYYQPQQQGMYYGQQPYGQQYGRGYGPPVGYYGNQRSGASEGLCAGLLAALTCCCCLDFMF